mmetsp:Transcript_1518/g.5573  ORF Transcript_1518/g.5573 Transcript_1518/m.5573 type:complete len:561 (-) Transcript_1518:340-2022(-)
MSVRSSESGGPTNTLSSKRPGRTSAASKVSRRCVAAKTVKPSLPCSTPSSSVSSVATSRTCTVEPLATSTLAREAPMASTSSKKRTQGRAALARAKASRSAVSDSPRYAFNSSEQRTLINAASISRATARARSVLPQPGGPWSTTPRGGRTPKRRSAAARVRGHTSAFVSASLASRRPPTSGHAARAGVGASSRGGTMRSAASSDCVAASTPAEMSDHSTNSAPRANAATAAASKASATAARERPAETFTNAVETSPPDRGSSAPTTLSSISRRASPSGKAKSTVRSYRFGLRHESARCEASGSCPKSLPATAMRKRSGFSRAARSSCSATRSDAPSSPGSLRCSDAANAASFEARAPLITSPKSSTTRIVGLRVAAANATASASVADAAPAETKPPETSTTPPECHDADDASSTRRLASTQTLPTPFSALTMSHAARTTSVLPTPGAPVTANAGARAPRIAPPSSAPRPQFDSATEQNARRQSTHAPSAAPPVVLGATADVHGVFEVSNSTLTSAPPCSDSTTRNAETPRPVCTPTATPARGVSLSRLSAFVTSRAASP